MKKKINHIILFLLIVSLCFLLPSCSSDVDDNANYANVDMDSGESVFYRQVAREMTDDGWVFTFVKNGLKDPEEDKNADDLIRYQFFGINIRYRALDGYEERVTQEKIVDGETVSYTETYVPGILIWGSANEAQKRDFEMIHELLKNERTTEELLALNLEDYQFEELDRELFFRLMKIALKSEWQKEGKLQSYWEKPSYAMLQEPDFMDGYKLQVSFLQETGCVDELFIDVLYKNQTDFHGYDQLSDLVDKGKADEEQVKLWEKICSITDMIKEEELFITGKENYQDMELAGVDLSKLYTFLKNIHENKYERYIPDKEMISQEKSD